MSRQPSLCLTWFNCYSAGFNSLVHLTLSDTPVPFGIRRQAWLDLLAYTHSDNHRSCDSISKAIDSLPSSCFKPSACSGFACLYFKMLRATSNPKRRRFIYCDCILRSIALTPLTENCFIWRTYLLCIHQREQGECRSDDLEVVSENKKILPQGNNHVVIIFLHINIRHSSLRSPDFPDKPSYPILEMGGRRGRAFYAVIMTLPIGYVFLLSFFSPSACYRFAAVSSAWFAPYFKLLRTTTDKPTQHRSIYQGHVTGIFTTLRSRLLTHWPLPQ